MIIKAERGVGYEVDEHQLSQLTAAFDLWRDGLGKLSGPLGRAAFLRATSDIVRRFVPPDRSDAWKLERYTRALRIVLAQRPRKSGPMVLVAS